MRLNGLVLRRLGCRRLDRWHVPRVGRLLHDSPNYRISLFSFASYTLAAPILGMAQAAVEHFQTSKRQQTSVARGGDIAGLSTIQMRLAESTAEVWAAQLILQQDIADILGRARRDEEATVMQRLHVRRNQAYVAKLCVRAVNRIFEGSGEHDLYDSSPLQRYHRDIHAASHHVSLSWDTSAEQYGRVTLGLEPTNRRY
jgi:3-hydroxy-9,10-secoandrosta-1,3,5(10)-triene-9,17-dione monooxygenase